MIRTPLQCLKHFACPIPAVAIVSVGRDAHPELSAILHGDFECLATIVQPARQIEVAGCKEGELMRALERDFSHETVHSIAADGGIVPGGRLSVQRDSNRDSSGHACVTRTVRITKNALAACCRGLKGKASPKLWTSANRRGRIFSATHSDTLPC